MVIASGSGSRLTDDKGRSYLDFGGNWALANLGYDNKNVQTAIQRQLENTSYAGIVSSINEPALLLAEKLIQLMPGDFKKKGLVWVIRIRCSGSSPKNGFSKFRKEPYFVIYWRYAWNK
ncbi:MAG: hypothetical protein CM1200mP8_1480 [Chloroflexota bacterium]|nr:MAG: hypothetical protein CM1200mP8_1480 [Chloroflexota bacterium]